jgi:hypothetical protein
MRYELTPVPNSNEYLLTVHMEWEMENFSYDTRQYEPYFAEDEAERPRLLYLACDAPENQKFYENNPTTELIGDIRKTVHSAARVRSIAPGVPPFTYRMGYTLDTPRRATDWHLFSFVGITEKVRLEVNAPANLVVGVYPNRATKQPNVWMFEDVFMKEQHITVYWRPH